MYDRDALIAATDLTGLADELLGGHHGSDRSPSWRCPDPHHAQTGRTPPVTIFTSNRGEQRWRCHGCGAGGTAIDLVMACCRTNPRYAMEILADRAGHREQEPSWTPGTRTPPPPTVRRCQDQAGLDRYVDDCAHALFTTAGQRIRRWLNDERSLSDDVLAANKIGADLGPRYQERPDGMPRAGGVVLPVLAVSHATYAQIRVPHPRPNGPRYLNPASELAPNPRLAHIQPVERRHREVIVCEGIIDALSAAAAGYRAAAVLSAAYPDQVIALELARLAGPLVVAFDRDAAGQAAAERLTALLDTHGRHPAKLVLADADLNAALHRSTDWPKQLELRVNAASWRCGVGLSPISQ